MAKANKFCSLDGIAGTADRARMATGEIVGTAFKSALDMKTDVISRLKDSAAQALKFTWVIADNLKKLGINEGEQINRALERQRAHRERLRRYAEDVIQPFVNLHKRNKEAALKVDELGNLATTLEVNPFLESGEKYKSKDEAEKKAVIDGKEMTKYEAWEILREDLNKLSKMDSEAPKILQSLFDSYKFFRRDLLRSLIQSRKDREGEGDLADSETSPAVFDYIEKLKDQYNKANIDPYLPLSRSGKYVVNVFQTPSTKAEAIALDPKLEETYDEANPRPVLVESQFFENKSEARAYAEQLRKDGVDPNDIMEFKRTDIEKFLYGMSSRGPINAFFDKLRPELEGLKPALDPTDPGYNAEVARIEQFKKKLQEMSLLLYPETSVRKMLVAKRKGTEGYIRDTLRTFTIMSDRFAGQISQIEGAGKIDKLFSDLTVAVKNIKDPDKQEAASNYTKELMARVYALNQNPSFGSKFANAANQLGFTWFLGLNPASAMVNIFQVPGVALPYLSARFEGQVDNLKELTRAYITLSKFDGYIMNGTISERVDDLIQLNAEQLKKFDLTRDEVLMLKELDDIGALRSGMQIYDINSVADMGGAYPGSFAHGLYVFQKLSGGMFQKAELINREVTALAAYRLARKKAMIGKSKPLTHEEAWEFAGKAVEQSQGAYAEDQAPRVFMNPAVRTILMFKKFPAHMAAVYVRMFKDMMGPDVDPAVRRIARRQFTGMMGIAAFFSGVAGMPFFYIIRDIMQAALGDEDDPYNFDLELRKFLIEQLGPQAGNMMYRGFLGEFGLDIGSRISYESSFLLGGANVGVPFIGGVLGLRDVKQGQTAQETMLNTLGEAAGAGFGIVTGVARGYEKMKKGDVYEGIEAMTPAFIRNPMKAGRYATEGALTARGDPIIEDITTGEVIGQMFGFSPQRLSSQYKINNQIKDIEQAVLKRRNSLMDSYAKAVREKDRDTQNEIRDEIREFNKANPGKGLAITQETIRRSLKKRESISKETEKGIFITKGVRPRISEYKDVEEPQ
jgi:hypothetical protein